MSVREAAEGSGVMRSTIEHSASSLWKMIAVVVVALVAAILMGPTMIPAQAGTGDNYPEPWRSAPMGHYDDTWGYASRYCTSWVAWALHDRNKFEMPKAIGHARNWGHWAAKPGNVGTVNKIPAPGAVAWWDSYDGAGIGEFGHVAWVKSVNSDGTVTIEDYNGRNKGSYDSHPIRKGSPTGYIHFKDLKEDPLPPATGKRIGVLEGNGDLYVKEGGVDAPWELMTTNVRDFRIEGDRIAALTTGGKLVAKEGSLDARWSTISSGGVVEFEITNNRLGILDKNRRLYVKEGPLNARWKLLSRGVKEFELSPKRVAVLNARNNLHVKEGSLDARWVLLANGVAGFDITDKRVGFRNGNDVLYVKHGKLSASWVRVMNGADEFKLKDDRIAVLDRNQTLSVKEGGLSAQWVTLTSASDFDITADRVSVLQGNQVSVKEGGLSADWTRVAAGIVEHDLS